MKLTVAQGSSIWGILFIKKLLELKTNISLRILRERNGIIFIFYLRDKLNKTKPTLKAKLYFPGISSQVLDYKERLTCSSFEIRTSLSTRCHNSLKLAPDWIKKPW